MILACRVIMTPNILNNGLAFSVILFIFLSSFSSVVCSFENSNFSERKYVEYEDDIPPIIEIIYPVSKFQYL